VCVPSGPGGDGAVAGAAGLPPGGRQDVHALPHGPRSHRYSPKNIKIKEGKATRRLHRKSPKENSTYNTNLIVHGKCHLLVSSQWSVSSHDRLIWYHSMTNTRHVAFPFNIIPDGVDKDMGMPQAEG
jgi:hypothetical protein